MPDTSKLLAAALSVLLAASIAGTGTERTAPEQATPTMAAPAETGRGPVGRITCQSATPTGPATPGRQ